MTTMMAIAVKTRPKKITMTIRHLVKRSGTWRRRWRSRRSAWISLKSIIGMAWRLRASGICRRTIRALGRLSFTTVSPCTSNKSTFWLSRRSKRRNRFRMMIRSCTTTLAWPTSKSVTTSTRWNTSSGASCWTTSTRTPTTTWPSYSTSIWSTRRRSISAARPKSSTERAITRTCTGPSRSSRRVTWSRPSRRYARESRSSRLMRNAGSFGVSSCAQPASTRVPSTSLRRLSSWIVKMRRPRWSWIWLKTWCTSMNFYRQMPS